MLMYNLLDYSGNYCITSGRLWNYYGDIISTIISQSSWNNGIIVTEVNDDTNENDVTNYRINNNKTTTSKSLEYKTEIAGRTPVDSSRLDAEVVVPLKYLSNFWRFLNLP